MYNLHVTGGNEFYIYPDMINGNKVINGDEIMIHDVPNKYLIVGYTVIVNAKKQEREIDRLIKDSVEIVAICETEKAAEISFIENRKLNNPDYYLAIVSDYYGP